MAQMGRQRTRIVDDRRLELKEKVIHINRVAKVVKGGRRFSFSALVVVGDGDGHVGVGLGKANEVPRRSARAIERGARSLVTVPLVDGHDPARRASATSAPARCCCVRRRAGTGVIAGGGVRAVVESAGIHNVLTKCLGSNNPHNMVQATIAALAQLREPEQVAALRGKTARRSCG